MSNIKEGISDVSKLEEKVREIYRDHNDIGTTKMFKNRELVKDLKEANSERGDILSLTVEGKDIFVPQLFLGSKVSKDMVGYPEYLVYVYDGYIYEPILTEGKIALEEYMTALKVINGDEIIKETRN